MKSVKLPAAALAAAPAPQLSERYVMVSTAEVIEGMRREGWEVAAATSAAPRKNSAQHTRHMIDFRRPETPVIDGLVPRVLFLNSHDGSTSARVMAGLFRFVCANGLVVGNMTHQHSARHSGYGATEFVNEMNRLAEQFRAAQERMARWQERELTSAQMRTYAQLVSQLRYGDAYAYEGSILTPRRAEDDAGTLYAVFNRAQENAVRGGIPGMSRSGRRATARPLAELDRDVNFNAALWRLTEELEEHWS